MLLLFFMSVSSFSAAQPGGQARDDMRERRHERIRQARQAFITEQLELNEAEATAFFPVFWAYEEQREEIRKEGLRGRRSPDLNISEMTEAEAKAAILKLQQERKRIADLSIEAENKYLEILTAKKVLQLEVAERAFRKKLWDRMGHQRKRN